MTALTRHRERILGWIEEDRAALVDFLSRFVASPSPHPPGDSRAACGEDVDMPVEDEVPAGAGAREAADAAGQVRLER
ncbi:MAG: hypothetical protein ACKOUS_23620, partial [Alphaproteobacteria bacterium]